MEHHGLTHVAVAAVDVGGTTIKGAVVNGDGAFLRERSRPTPATGKGGAAMEPVLARLAELDAHVLRVGVEEGLPIATLGLPEQLQPILEIPPLQRLAWRLALDRGIDPDRPRGLSKVTQTL